MNHLFRILPPYYAAVAPALIVNEYFVRVLLPQPDGNTVSTAIQPTMLSWQLAAFGLVIAVTAFPRLGALFSWRPLTAL